MKKQIKKIQTNSDSFSLFTKTMISPQQLSAIKGGDDDDSTGVIGTEDVVDG